MPDIVNIDCALKKTLRFSADSYVCEYQVGCIVFQIGDTKLARFYKKIDHFQGISLYVFFD